LIWVRGDQGVVDRLQQVDPVQSFSLGRAIAAQLTALSLVVADGDLMILAARESSQSNEVVMAGNGDTEKCGRKWAKFSAYAVEGGEVGCS
jgi:hypothetical protein